MPCARVLLIETDPSIRETVRELLESDGYPTCVAGDYAEACRLVEAGCAPGAVVLDVGYPVEGALETMRRLRSEPWFRELPLVLTTAFPVTRDEHGTAPILEKPYDASALVGALRLVFEPPADALTPLGAPARPPARALLPACGAPACPGSRERG